MPVCVSQDAALAWASGCDYRLPAGRDQILYVEGTEVNERPAAGSVPF